MFLALAVYVFWRDLAMPLVTIIDVNICVAIAVCQYANKFTKNRQNDVCAKSKDNKDKAMFTVGNNLTS